MDQLGYRLLRGRQGAWGYIREMGASQALTAAGLTAGESYALRSLPRGETLAQGRADGEGHVSMTGRFPAPVFLSSGDQVALWEGEEQAYFQAVSCLRTKNAPKQAAALPEKAQPMQAETAPPAAQAETAEEPADAPPTREESPVILRPAGEGQPVDTLPPLLWPRGTEAVRQYMAAYPPIVPFQAAGWRFVRAPSPIKQLPYCVVGCRIQGDRVTGIVYAVPGNPYRPPAALPGYVYCAGSGGTGYWALWKQVGSAATPGSGPAPR
ncbi:MAG: hypothetical protein IJ662_00980 [Clostridia bacterium]|nr:hypothetical protein [Clostridia bacterium]